MLLLINIILLTLSNLSNSDRLCRSDCFFSKNFAENLTIPSSCREIRRSKCSVLINFDYIERRTSFDFDLIPSKLMKETGESSKTTVTSIFNLEDTTFARQTVEHFCSDEDFCDWKFVENEGIFYERKTSCDKIGGKFVEILYDQSLPGEFECFLNDTTVGLCESPCEFMEIDSAESERSCDGLIDLAFQTSLSRTTKNGETFFQDRIFSYACTKSLCNGVNTEKQIRSIIDDDRGSCLISLNETFSGNSSSKIDFPQFFLFVIFLKICFHLSISF